jgi:Xaa-Pro aminopeptidase
VTYEAAEIAAEYPDQRFVTFSELGDPWETVAGLLRETGAQRVIIEKTMPVGWAEALRLAAPGIEVVASSRLPMEPRIIKDAGEIATLEEGSLAAERAIAAGVELTEAGVSERDVARQIADRFRSEFRERVSDLHGICMATANLEQNHHTFSDTRIEGDGPIRLGLLGRLDGYWILLTRMHLVGHNVSYEELHKEYAGVYEQTLRLLRPGVDADYVYRACRRLLEATGFTLTSAKVGHGTGLEFRENPWLSQDRHEALRPGMVFAYDFGTAPISKWMFHVEDRVVIDDDGPRRLSRLWDHRDPRRGHVPALESRSLPLLN